MLIICLIIRLKQITPLNIPQLDGNQTISDSLTNESSVSSYHEVDSESVSSDHEVDSEPIPTQFHQLNDSKLEVIICETYNVSRLPLC